jgi:hypothetical protein
MAAEFPIDLRNGYTDFLIVIPWSPNYSNIFKEFFTHLGERLFAVGVGEPLRSEILLHRRKNRFIYEQILRTGYLQRAYGLNVLVIHPTRTLIGVTSMDHGVIEAGMLHAYRYVGHLIDTVLAKEHQTAAVQSRA